MADTPAWALYAQWQAAAWTLYAQWQKASVAIILNPYTGNLPPDVIPIIFASVGQPYPTLPTPTRLNRSFAGWYSLANRALLTPESVVPAEDDTLIAMWSSTTPIVVTISYETNTSDVAPPASTTADYGYSYGGGKLPALTRPQYRFDGWFTASYGDTPLRGDFGIIDPNDHTLYARWTYVGPDGGSSDPSAEPQFVGGFVPQVSPSPPAPGLGSLIYDPTTGQLVADI